jgi:hypothetical protein
MTILEALAILESATVECKQRNINTSEVSEALDFLEPHIKPAWLVLQFRHHALGERTNNDLIGRGNSRCYAQLSLASATKFENFSGYG